METTKLLENRGRRVALRATALLLAAACAGGGGAATAAGLEGAVKGGELAPGKGSATYGGEGSSKCQRGAISTYVLEYLADGAKAAKRPEPKADPRVCAISEAFLGWEPGAVPRPQVLAFISQWAGLPVSVKVPIVADFDERDQRTIAERVVQSAAGSAALNSVNPRIGLTTQRIKKGRDEITRISIVVADVPVEIAPPVPRRLEKGQQVNLTGRLVGGVKNPKVFVTDAEGKLSTPEQQPGDAFQAPLACGDRSGKIQVEIRGEYEGSSGLVASFPVWCGEDPPTAVSIAGEPWPTDPQAATRKIYEALNAERKVAGASELKWDPAVAGVAEGIAADIAKNGASGGGDVVERLKKEGISSPLVLQSAAAERNFERANERILASPRDRAALLNRDATNVGVGAVSAKDATGNPVVYVVEVLIKELPPVDLAAVRQKLREEIERKRKDARTTALKPDATLDELAEKFAQALAAAGGTLSKEQASELTAPLNKSFKSVTMLSGAKQDPVEFAEEPQTTVPGKVLGVGVAQGHHPVLGRNAVYVTIMVGTPRAGAEEAGAAPAKKKKATAPKK